jgi:putative phosphonate metabolism protein
MSYQRYAIYYTPQSGALARFGAAWLGWDMTTGTARAAPDVPGLEDPAHTLTETPRRYGFHATLKPPFRLAEGQTASALTDAVEALAKRLPPAHADALAVTRLGRFVALTVEGDSDEITACAASVVDALDCFRAPLTQADLERYGARPLSDRQRELLQHWGYPYVMEQFRFHMTLSSRLPVAKTRALQAALSSYLADMLPTPFTLDALTLAGEDTAGMFHTLSRHRLGG